MRVFFGLALSAWMAFAAGFRVDPSWPQLPNHWVMGPGPSIAVDRHDNVWLLQRSRLVPPENRDRAAPPVVEFDSKGKFLQAWGGPGKGYQWPATEHNIFVDQKDNVWISGAGTADNMLLKFSARGEFQLQIGAQGMSSGNADTKNLNRPADAFVHAGTNEVFVADGYGNQRIIVFDADTGAFRRMWEADFHLPHSSTVSSDGLVYVADTTARDLQVFSLDGKFLSKIPIHLDGTAARTAAAVALSPDPEQTLLYVADYGNSQIMTIDRKSLKTLATFGTRGAAAGDFQGLHDIALDSQGNLYTAEVTPGSRFQRFTPIAPAIP